MRIRIQLKQINDPSLGGLFGKSDWPPSRGLKLLLTAAKSRVWILLIANQVVAPSYVMDLATVVTSRYLLFKGEGPDFEVLSGSEGQGFVVGWVVRWTAHPLCRRSIYDEHSHSCIHFDFQKYPPRIRRWKLLA